ncbi:hypothetical protein [Neobacillus niacini]|uniref:hypothetical protein n=1 Tax=Neobacillus niacini TaxID=86668 RepID=UPI00286757A8|nr:hypothetical protein [Neobacillus niacini]MDR7000244.1 hypothetical protein [Neobacillus niacini]
MNDAEGKNYKENSPIGEPLRAKTEAKLHLCVIGKYKLGKVYTFLLAEKSCSHLLTAALNN